MIKLITSLLLILFFIPVSSSWSWTDYECNNYCISNYYGLIDKNCLNFDSKNKDLSNKCDLYCEKDFPEYKNNNCYLKEKDSNKFRYLLLNKKSSQIKLKKD